MGMKLEGPSGGGSATGLVADAINDGTTTVAPSQNAVFDALASKANSANPTLTGTVTVPDASFSLAKLANISTARYLGRRTASSGPIEEITIAQVKTDLGISTPPSVAPGTISGGSQNLGLPGVIIAGPTNARAIFNNRMWYVPFVTNGSMTVDQMVCEVTTGVASSKLRMGVYAADAAWQPTGAALIDTGDISAASAAVKTATVSATLPPGRYLACIFADLAGVIVRAATVTPTWATEINTAAFVGGTGSIIPGVMRALTKTYGALTTATPWDSYVSSYTGAAGDWPLILLRWT